jgi:hypothetical protein
VNINKAPSSTPRQVYPESVDGVLAEVGAYDSSYAIKKTLWKKNHG